MMLRRIPYQALKVSSIHRFFSIYNANFLEPNPQTQSRRFNYLLNTRSFTTQLSLCSTIEEMRDRVNNWSKQEHNTQQCPLCNSQETSLFHTDAKGKNARVYYRCHDCSLTYVPQSLWLDYSAECSRYESHINDVNNEGYVNFLRKAADPLMDLLLLHHGYKNDNALNSHDNAHPNNTKIIKTMDYGCGPGPTIHQIITKYPYNKDSKEHSMRDIVNQIEMINYDPYFHPSPTVPQSWITQSDNNSIHRNQNHNIISSSSSSCVDIKPTSNGVVFDPTSTNAFAHRYDAIICTEVLEHLHHPLQVLENIKSLLIPSSSSFFIIMTGINDDDNMFYKWPYRSDPTHVCFYKEPTMKYIGDVLNMNVDRVNENVFVFRSS